MELKVTACDPEEERSRKILQLENEQDQGRGEYCSRSSFCCLVDVFREKIEISGFMWRQKLRIRMREAATGMVTKIEDSKQNIMHGATARMEHNFYENMPQRRAIAFLAALPGVHALGRMHSSHV